MLLVEQPGQVMKCSRRLVYPLRMTFVIDFELTVSALNGHLLDTVRLMSLEEVQLCSHQWWAHSGSDGFKNIRIASEYHMDLESIACH